MTRKELIIAAFAAFALFVSFGTAFAGNMQSSMPGEKGTNYLDNQEQQALIGTERGAEIVASPGALQAARDYVYNEKQLALIGTEGGGEIVASAKALQAASDYVYNEEQLARIGTERGAGVFEFDNQSSRTNEAVADKRDSICSKC